MTETRSLTGKVVAVTGGAGFIGSHLCDSLIERQPNRLIIVDDFSLGKERNVEHLRHSRIVEVCRLDASDHEAMQRLFEREQVDITFNMAIVPLPASLVRPKDCIDKNILVTSTLCEMLRMGSYETLIHCSSSEAYGSALYVPMDEDHPTRPITPYAASKVASDYIALSYHTTFGLDIAVARPFNSYGPRQNDETYAAVVPITIKRIMMGKQPIIYGDGLQTRDYTYVEDIAAGISRLYEIISARGKILNLASGREITIKALVETIANLLGYSGHIIYEKPRPGDVRRHRGDISLARKTIGYSPKTDYITGLKSTIEWYKSIYCSSDSDR